MSEDWRNSFEWNPPDRVEFSPAPATLGEVWDASRTLQATDNSDAADRRLESAWRAPIDAINDVRRREGKPLLLNPVHGIRALAAPDPATASAAGFAAQANVGQATVISDAVAEIARIKRQYPGALKDVPDDADKILAPVLRRERAARDAARETLGRSSGIVAGVVDIAGTVAKSIEDPAVIAQSVIGVGGGSLARVMAGELIVNFLGTLALQPQVARNREAIGEELTMTEGLANSAAAGVGGAIIGGGLHLAAPLLRGTASAAGSGYDAVIARVYDALPEAMRARWRSAAEIPESALPDIAEALVGADRLTPDLKAAAQVIRQGAQIEETSPFAPGWRNTQTHEEKLAAALAAVSNPPPPSPRGATALTSGTVTPPRMAPAGDSDMAAYLGAIRRAESGGNDRAAASGSSAYGRYQFTAPTWLAYYTRRFGRQGLSDAEILAKRADGGLQDRLVADLAADSAATLRRAGHAPTADNLYLLHFAGPRDGVRVVEAADGVPVRDLLSDAAVRANPFLKDMSAGELRAWAARKVGRAAPGGVDGARVAVDAGEDGARLAALDDEAARLDAALLADRPPPRDGVEVSPAAAMTQPEVEPVFVGVDRAAEQGELELTPQSVASDAPSPAFEIDPTSPAPLTEAIIRAGGIDIERGYSGQTADAAAHNERAQLIAMLTGENVPPRRFGQTEIIDRTYARPVNSLPYGLIDPRRGVSVDAVAERAADAGIIAGDTPAARREALLAKLGEELGGPADAGKAARLAAVADAVDQRAFKRWDADDPIWDEINRREAADAIAAAQQDDGAPIAAELASTRFDDPYGADAQAQVDSILHDLRLLAETDGAQTFRLEEEGGEKSLADILAEIDEDDAALEAVRGCL